MNNFSQLLSNGLVVRFLHPEGYQAILRDTLHVAISILKLLMYPSPRMSLIPASAAIPEKVYRNLEIFKRYTAGERAQNLAYELGISVRRVNWLINRLRRYAV